MSRRGPKTAATPPTGEVEPPTGGLGGVAVAPEGGRWGDLITVGLVALVLATSIVFGWFNRNLEFPDLATWQRGRLIAAAYDPPDQKVELFLNQGDGQIFAYQAMDPAVSRPEGIRGGEAEQAYRLQRPLLGWLGWMASGGQPEAVGWAVVSLTVVSVALLAVAIGWTAVRLGASAWWGMSVALAPGVVANLLRVGPESLGTALVVVGIGLWMVPGRSRWPAVAFFAVAGLARETLLLVPVVLAGCELWAMWAARTGRAADGRGPGAGRRGVSRAHAPAWAPLLAVVPYVAWVLFLRVRVGAFPVGRNDERLSLVPGSAVAHRMDGWRLDEWIAFGVLVVVALIALLARGDRRLKLIVAAHLVLGAALGAAVWRRYFNFGRVLLPLTVMAVLAIASGPIGRWSVGRSARNETGADPAT